MSKKGGWLTLGAKLLAIFLGLGALGAFLTAVLSFFTLGPESGAVGVVMIDSLFGSFILFTASRFLWIYAVKRERLAETEGH
jgi:hypothetical protein